MPGRRAPSRSLFAALPPELRSTIRVQGLQQARQGPSLESLQIKEGLVAETERPHINGNGNGDAGSSNGVELLRTQPRSPASVEDGDESGILEDEDLELGFEPGQGGSESAVGITAPSDLGFVRVEAETALKGLPGSSSVTINGGSNNVFGHPDRQDRSTNGDHPPTKRRRIDGPAVKRVREEVPFALFSGAGSSSLQPGSGSKRRKAKQKAVSNAYAGHPWDCTGLVPRYTSFADVPEDIQKYFGQRYSLFPEYDTLHLLMDHTGWFSVTAQLIARHIAERCRCDVIVDAFCGVGGNAIEFAKTCERVIAIDTDLTRLRLARHNALQYGVADRIEFIHGSYIDWARTYVKRAEKEAIDVVFLSPPWGGPDYLTISSDPLPFPPTPDKQQNHLGISNTSPTSNQYPLSAILPFHGKDLFDITSILTPNIAYYLPRNVNLPEVAALARRLDGPAAAGWGGGGRDREWVEVEEEWVGDRVKAVTAYFGSLVAEE